MTKKQMSILEAFACLFHGIHKAPLGFLWGLVVPIPIMFALVFDRCREQGRVLATIRGILWVVMASPLIAVGCLIAPFYMAWAVADGQKDAYGFKALRDALHGPAAA